MVQKIAFPERLTTARLTLSRHELTRADQIFGLIDADRARLSRFLPWVAWTQSAEDEADYINAVRDQWERYEFFDYAMFEGRTYLGNIGVHSINWQTGVAELGYWILGEHEGRGLVTEAAARLTDLCFERGFHRVEIRCDPGNARSARVPRRLGFHLEALLRQNAVDQFGRHHDTLVFARLAGEAPADEGPRPPCVSHWAELGLGPQSYYPDSLEVFGDVARLGTSIKNFEVEHHELPPGHRAWWPHAWPDREVMLFVLEGAPRLWLNGKLTSLVPGDVVTLTPAQKESHTVINEGPLDARVLVIRGRVNVTGAWPTLPRPDPHEATAD